MALVARLLTLVDIDDEDETMTAPMLAACRCRRCMWPVLTDGRRVVLLADRGWSGQLKVSWDRGAFRGGTPGRCRARNLGVRAVEQLEHEAALRGRPDEPFGGRTQADMEAEGYGTRWRGPPAAGRRGRGRRAEGATA